MPRELEWVKAHVLEGEKDRLARVEDAQQFVITAPGPASAGAEAKTQRECSSSSFVSSRGCSAVVSGIVLCPCCFRTHARRANPFLASYIL